MHHDFGRNRGIVHIDIGQHDAFAESASFNPAVFDICRLGNISFTDMAVQNTACHRIGIEALFPAEVAVCVHFADEKVVHFVRHSEMDVLRRNELDERKAVGVQRFPNLAPTAFEFWRITVFGRFLCKLFPRAVLREWIDEIGVKIEADVRIDECAELRFIDVSVGRYEFEKLVNDGAAEPDAARVDIDLIGVVDGTVISQKCLGTLMQEPRDVIVSVVFGGISLNKDAVILPDLNGRFHRQAGRLTGQKVELKRIEQQLCVARKNHHAASGARGDALCADEKLVKKRRDVAAGKQSRNRPEKLSAGRILRYAFAVPAGMNDENLLFQ